jgi:glycosyltransferase involved in cell wall biosynthesis
MTNKAAACRSDDSKRRIVHIITGLARGGAEANLYRLIYATRDSWDATVISLADEGFYGGPLRSIGVSVLCCRMNETGQAVPGFVRLLRFVRHSRADVVQTWMYHADLFGGVAARLLGFDAVLWGIRNLRFHPGRRSWSARAACWLCARLSKTMPVAIVSCSTQAAIEHRRRGYAGNKLLVIPNGYDCARLRPNKPAGQLVRSAWGILPTQFLVGMVARWDPLKDHANLLAALQPLMHKHDHVRCALIGPGMSEAFPNVVAEAMACGTPCVVTDVGDASVIVGDQGWRVPAGDPAALYEAMRAAMARLASGEAESLRTACRQRILQNFSQENMAAAYEDAWSKAIGSRRTAVSAQPGGGDAGA